MTRLIVLVLLVAGALASPAAASPVNVGQLDWSTVNRYDPTLGSTQRTYVGFVADARANPGAANGTVFPDGPATGPTVDASTPLDTAVTHVFPGKAAGSSYDPATRSGTLEYDGTLHFKSTKFDFDITVDDPQVVLTGSTGKLYASGVDGSKAAYGRGTSVFDLDLTGATYEQTDNVVTISGIAPSVTQGGAVFQGNYATGAGPDRNPNTFGTFTMKAELAPTVTVTPATALDPAGQTVTVSGTGASKSTQGLYVYLSPASAAPTDTQAAPVGASSAAFAWIRQPGISAEGAFSTTLVAKSPLQTGGGTVDCVLVPCVVRTIAAHFTDDRSQDTATPVTFKKTTKPPTTTPPTTTKPPATTPPTVTPPVTTPKEKPRASKLALTRKRVAFHLARKAKVEVSIKRRGKVVRKATFTAKKGRNERRIKRLRRAGTYRLIVNPVGAKAKRITVELGGSR